MRLNCSCRFDLQKSKGRNREKSLKDVGEEVQLLENDMGICTASIFCKQQREYKRNCINVFFFILECVEQFLSLKKIYRTVKRANSFSFTHRCPNLQISIL